MIIVQESDVRKTQPNHDLNVAVATSSTPLIPTGSPPPYTPREDPGPSSSSTLPYVNPLSPPVVQKRRPEPSTERFGKALLIALGIYFAIASVGRFLFFAFGPPPHGPHRRIGRPEPEDGRIISCMRGDDDEWSPTPRVQFPSFSIPLDSRAIYILARGQQANGKITVVPQTDINDTITVDIAAEYREWDTFKGTTVCLLERKLGERGIGIFTPKHVVWKNWKTDVEITVNIPHQLATPPLELAAFEIVAPDFQVALPNADKFVKFHDLIIHTANMPVSVGSVKAANIDIQTSKFPIHGTFITSSSLKLETSNAAITANISLENDRTSGKETPMYATTSDATPLSNMEAPRYTIRAATTNAELNLTFVQNSDSSHPSSSPILDITGNTSNGPAGLLLQPSFEGVFDVSTSLTSQADFSSGSTPESDPLGLGRQPHVDFMTNIKSRKKGRVYWGDPNDERELGRVELSTSNGPVSLRIR